MTYAAEAVKYQSAPRWVVEFTNGSTTKRYSDQYIAVEGVGVIEGKILSISSCRRILNYRLDNSGTTIEIADTDGDFESNGITKGWAVTVKSGFAPLAYSSWKTIATYEVAERPTRIGFSVTVRCSALVEKILGPILNQPKIEASDTFLFGTLNVNPARIGEKLPFRFGANNNVNGAYDAIYLGYGTDSLYFLANASGLSGAVGSVNNLFVDGEQVGYGSYSVSAETGNYQYLVISISNDVASKLELFDDDITRRQFKQSNAVLRKKLTINLYNIYGYPTDLFEYLLQYNGPGLLYRDSTSYSSVDSFLVRNEYRISGEILAEKSLVDIFNKVCSECFIKQYWTADGKHALYFPLSVTQTEASSGFSSALKFSDLNEVCDTVSFLPDSTEMARANTIYFDNNVHYDLISDSDAVTEYGTIRVDYSPTVIQNPVLARSLSHNEIQRNKTPRTIQTISTGLIGNKLELGDKIKATLRDAPESSGWSDRLLRIIGIEFNPIECKTLLQCEDAYYTEDQNSAYMAAQSGYEITSLTNCSFTSGQHIFSTTDSNASNVRSGDIIWYSSTTSDRIYCARVTGIEDLFIPLGFYLVVCNRLCGFTATVTTYSLRPSLDSGARCGRTSDTRMVNTAIYDYFAPSGLTPVAVYPLWEMDGQNPVDSVFGNSMTIASGPLDVDLNGQAGAALNFNGTSQYLYDTTAPSDLEITGEITVACWVYAESGRAANAKIAAVTGPSTSGLETDNCCWLVQLLTDNQIEIFWETGSGSNVYEDSVTTINNNEWTFVAVTRASNGVCKFYFGTNDTAVSLVRTSGTKTMPTGGTNCRLTIGADARYYNNFWKGSLSLLYVDNAEYSLAQIETLHNASKRVQCSTVV